VTRFDHVRSDKLALSNGAKKTAASACTYQMQVYGTDLCACSRERTTGLALGMDDFVKQLASTASKRRLEKVSGVLAAVGMRLEKSQGFGSCGTSTGTA
jgi:hypothetical protein